ncbi:acyltransferase family protein [Larkinella sp. VNQ87]|uniref:acyltransferase family protein n=1 Tax=Larkinella sp. VNQ87 TaxID=3400921 RepID=UPI003C2BBCFE
MILCPPVSTPQTFRSIQAMRALAALLVTLFHLTAKMDNIGIQSPLLNCFRAGFGGVDLFFIISGFIITHTSISKFGTPRQWLPYLKKRFIRIYSLYWILLLLASVGLLVFRLFTPSLQWVRYAFSPLTLLKAILLLPSHESPLLVTWTLSHELYFTCCSGA